MSFLNEKSLSKWVFLFGMTIEIVASFGMILFSLETRWLFIVGAFVALFAVKMKKQNAWDKPFTFIGISIHVVSIILFTISLIGIM